jgi:MFS family permease
MNEAGYRNAHKKWLKYCTLEGAFANVFINYTGGAFIIGLALFLGANDFQIGLLAAIPFLSQLFQLTSTSVSNRLGGRRKAAIALSAVGRQIWWIIPIILLTNFGWRLGAMLVIVLVSNICIMSITPAWISWMADIVPERVRGRFFGTRSSALAMSTAITALAGGAILDFERAHGHENIGFAILTAIACLFAFTALLLLRKIPEPRKGNPPTMFSWPGLVEPLKNRSFRKLLIVFFAWHFSIGISAAFFAPHMLSNLGMSFTLISLYSVASLSSAIFLNRLWGSLIDRFGSKPVATFCAFGIAIIPLVWLIPRRGFLIILAFEALYTGGLWAGFNLAAFNLPLANSPKANRLSYLAMFSVVTGIAFFISSLIGGIITESLSSFAWKIGPQTIVNYHVVFVISAVLRTISAGLITTFHEPKEKSVPIMMHFMGYAMLKRISIGRQLIPWSPKREGRDELDR